MHNMSSYEAKSIEAELLGFFWEEVKDFYLTDNF